MDDRIMRSRLLKIMLPLWIKVIRDYAANKQIFVNRNLCQAKHKSAIELADHLSLYLKADDPLEVEILQRKIIERRRKRMLNQLVVVKPKIILRPPSAQSCTPVTPLYSARAKNFISSPATEGTSNEHVISHVKTLLSEIREVLDMEIDKINEIRASNNDHAPGSYDILLSIILENIGFTINVDVWNPQPAKMETFSNAVFYILSYTCMLNFDKLLATSSLPGYKKSIYSVGSGLCLEANNTAGFDRLSEELEYILFALKVISLPMDDDCLMDQDQWLVKCDLNNYCNFTQVLSLLTDLPMPPKYVIAAVDAVVLEIKKNFVATESVGFQIALEKFKKFFMQSPWKKMGDTIDVLKKSKHSAQVTPSFEYGSEGGTPFTQYTFSKTPPPMANTPRLKI